MQSDASSLRFALCVTGESSSSKGAGGRGFTHTSRESRTFDVSSVRLISSDCTKSAADHKLCDTCSAACWNRRSGLKLRLLQCEATTAAANELLRRDSRFVGVWEVMRIRTSAFRKISWLNAEGASLAPWKLRFT